ncbi:hypothetical protein Lal_00043310 [Lupinus albus]|nr:hypothetical protein Lal_00043310 [Lupinus albus]
MSVVQNFTPSTIIRYEASHHFLGVIEDPTSFILNRGLHFANQIYKLIRLFFTSKYTGTLLIASSQDGNRRIFSIAFAIVEG